MRLETLSYLVDLKESHSISQTAEKFFISHQALSKNITALEKELGILLLERSQKGVSFTATGERFLLFAQNVLTEKTLLEQDFKRHYSFPSVLQRKTLSIYALPRYITPKFLSFIKKMRNSPNNYDIKLHNSTTKNIFSEITFDTSTLGLVTTHYPLNDRFLSYLEQKDLSFSLIESSPLYICAHKNSKLIKNEKFDSTSFKFVGFNYTSYEPIQAYTPPQYVVDSFELQHQLLQQKDCYTKCTVKEYNMFFKKNCSLMTSANEPVQSIINFIAVYSKNHTAFIEDFLQIYKTSDCLK